MTAREGLSGIPIFVGTAGWQYKDWSPQFYPPTGLKDADRLTYYAAHFTTVEVNSTYYTYLAPSVAEGWLRKVEPNDAFRFLVKVHGDFTHAREFTPDSENKMRALLSVLARNERLGGVLVQFPYSFGFNQVNTAFVDSLAEVFGEFNPFFEVRHNSWHKPEARAFWNATGYPLCSIDQPTLGSALPFCAEHIGGVAYLRLHGRNENEWRKSIARFGESAPTSYDEQNQRYSYLYSPSEIAEFIQQLHSVAGGLKQVVVILNNHPKGQAVANAFEFMYMLGLMTSLIPDTTVTAYPRLAKINDSLRKEGIESDTRLRLFL